MSKKSLQVQSGCSAIIIPTLDGVMTDDLIWGKMNINIYYNNTCTISLNLVQSCNVGLI